MVDVATWTIVKELHGKLAGITVEDVVVDDVSAGAPFSVGDVIRDPIGSGWYTVLAVERIK